MMTFSKQQLLAAGLVVLNLLVLTPTGFFASHIWNETQAWQAETEAEIKDMKKSINLLKADIPERYASKDTVKEIYSSIQKSLDRVNQRLTHLK